jgi:hypothetical protein
VLQLSETRPRIISMSRAPQRIRQTMLLMRRHRTHPSGMPHPPPPRLQPKMLCMFLLSYNKKKRYILVGRTAATLGISRACVLTRLLWNPEVAVAAVAVVVVEDLRRVRLRLDEDLTWPHSHPSSATAAADQTTWRGTSPGPRIHTYLFS